MSALAEFRLGPFTAREAQGQEALGRALALRGQVFRRGSPRPDRDGYDRDSRHVLIEDSRGGAAVATFRFQLCAPVDLAQGYAGQFYDLRPLETRAPRLAEIGRLCMAPAPARAGAAGDSADILRLILAVLAELMLTGGAGVLFGCASFAGADTRRHAGALALLAHRHADPAGDPPRAFAPARAPAARDDRAGIPPLLGLYLGMGAWCGPDAVADHDLDTLHVLTVLERRAIPSGRERAMLRLWRACRAA